MLPFIIAIINLITDIPKKLIIIFAVIHSFPVKNGKITSVIIKHVKLLITSSKLKP
jgi:hypothetical protein